MIIIQWFIGQCSRKVWIEMAAGGPGVQEGQQNHNLFNPTLLGASKLIKTLTIASRLLMQVGFLVVIMLI